jgi:biofilm PGA synthesis protein PgaD
MPDDAYIVSLKPIGRRQRARDTVLTLLMWGIYIYLWIPLITLGAWLVGFERFYEVVILYGGFDVIMDMLDWYAAVIITISTVIVTWSGINYRRFHNNERRRSAGAASARDLSEFFGVPEKEIERVRKSRRLQIDLDDLGYISNITHYGYVEDDAQHKTIELEPAPSA